VGMMSKKTWEEWEIEYLIENFDKFTYVEIAKKLNRNEKSVINKIFYERKKIREALQDKGVKDTKR